MYGRDLPGLRSSWSPHRRVITGADVSKREAWIPTVLHTAATAPVVLFALTALIAGDGVQN